MDKIFYIHGGGDTIGGIETYLSQSIPYHKYYKPYVGIVKIGKFSEYLSQSYPENIVDLKGGRLKNIHKTIKAIHNAVKFIKENNISILIAHGNHSWVYGSVIAKFCKVKSIYYIHNILRKEDKKKTIVKLAQSGRPHLYLVNSKCSAASLSETIKAKAIIHYPGVDHKIFCPGNSKQARENLLKEFSLPQNSFIFVIVGRIQEWKGQNYTIRAFKKMKNKDKCHLLIVGDCSFDQDQKYYDLCQKEAVGENITFTGFRDNVSATIQGSNVVVHSSALAEPFGLVVVEGMLCKKPVIASCYGGPTEIISNKQEGLLVDPQDTVAFSEQMDLLYGDPVLRQEIIEKGYQKAVENFTVQSSIEKLEQICISKFGNIS